VSREKAGELVPLADTGFHLVAQHADGQVLSDFLQMPVRVVQLLVRAGERRVRALDRRRLHGAFAREDGSSLFKRTRSV
jgi:hypothetical protein